MKPTIKSILGVLTLGLLFSQKGIAKSMKLAEVEPGIRNPNRSPKIRAPRIPAGVVAPKVSIAICKKIWRNRHGKEQFF
jgi:hypothetical protein